MNTDKNDNLVVECPHCNEHILLEKLNCCIFRHGVLKETRQQINPHASKELCDFYKRNDLIFGCGKPFKVILQKQTNNEDHIIVEICDYI